MTELALANVLNEVEIVFCHAKSEMWQKKYRFFFAITAKKVDVMWRMPTPGVSTFPSSTCLKLTIPADQVTQGSRFLALYLYAKSNSVNIFYFYNPDTCTIASFGING